MNGEQVGRLRLWPLKSGLKFAGRVREELSPELAAAGIEHETTAWSIVRSARDIDLDVKTAKARRDIRLAELEIEEAGERPQLLLALGEAWTTLEEPLKAAGWFRRAIDDSPAASSAQLEAYYGLLTSFDHRPGVQDQQLATCLEALEVFPLDAQLLCAMGSYLQAKGRLDLATRSYQMAVEHGAIDLKTWHLANLADLAVICLSMTLELQELADDSRECVERAINERPNSQRLRRRLIELHIKHNRRQEALAQIEHLPVAISQREPLRNAIRGGCMAAQGQWSAALPYLKTAHAAGCHDPICLRWLAIGLLGTGELNAAETALRQWQLAAPENPEPARLRAELAAKAGQRIDRPLGNAVPAPAFPQLNAPLSSHNGAFAL